MTWSLMQGRWTASMIAAENGHVNVVQYFVEAGANLDAADEVSGDVVWEYVDV